MSASVPARAPRAPLHAALALLRLAYAAATILYVAVWMVGEHRGSRSPVELGFNAHFVARDRSLAVDSVYAASPAARAGLKVGDRILSLDGAPIADEFVQARIWQAHVPGDSIRLALARTGRAPTVVTGVFRRPLTVTSGPTDAIAGQVLDLLPIPFLVVGLTVLFLRLESPLVWLLALLFGSFIAVPGSPGQLALLGPVWRTFGVAYQLVMVSVAGPLFFWLFSVFPVRSPLDRRLPWFKWAAVAFGLSLTLGAVTGDDSLRLIPPLSRLAGERVSMQAPFWFEFGFILLGLLSLAWNRLEARNRDALRRIRVVFWGTLVGVGPSLALAGAHQLRTFATPLWVSALVDVVVLSIFPLSFAYAILRHRVLDIPVLLKNSARYVLVLRGFGVLLSLVSVGLTVLFALSFTSWLRPAREVAQPLGVSLGAAFGGALLLGGLQVQRRVRSRIDRAFFRSAYDARVILEDLARRSTAATGREELAALLEGHLREALHPVSLHVYLLGSEGRLERAGDGAPGAPAALPAEMPFLVELARRGVPVEMSEDPAADAEGRAPLAALGADSLVPLVGREGRLVGMLALGPRRSDEPYSGEDKRLLVTVASQAATALENIRLAGEIAEKMEAERRVTREMSIAREVQGRLLPQGVPTIAGLEIAAHCLQARSVGGDYYDFLELGPGEVGFVLADVSGKGIHAALLMANLQAHLRSQSAAAPHDPVRFLGQVNHMLWRSTDPGHFATLFLGIYEDATRRLRYVNCGHNPPALLRGDGAVEWLAATATVIGAFEKWESAVGEVRLAPGDLLAVYSDGVTEATRGDEQFGEERLVQALRERARGPVGEIVSTVLARVQDYGAGGPSDDLTLLVARAR